MSNQLSLHCFSQVGNTGAQEAVRTPVTVLHKISTKNAYVHVKWPGTNGRPDSPAFEQLAKEAANKTISLFASDK